MLESVLVPVWILRSLCFRTRWSAARSPAVRGSCGVTWNNEGQARRRLRRVKIHWVPLVLIVLAAAWFAFVWRLSGARCLGTRVGSFAHVVNIAIIAGAVWLVTKMIAVGSERPRTRALE